MTEVLQANIFFMIASAATIVFCILVVVILYHVIKIMQSVRRIIERIEQGSEVIAEDMAQVRNFFAQGSVISRILGMFMSTQQTRKKRKDD